MFTGIIHSTARLKKINKFQNHFSFILEAKIPVSKKDIGTSIAINGVCLTLIHFKKSQKCYDLQFGLNETKMTTNSSNTGFLTNDLYQMKRSIVVDVIVEAIFILGKTSNFTSTWSEYIRIQR